MAYLIGGTSANAVPGRTGPMGQPRDSTGRYISTRWFWFVLGVLLALGMIADGGILA